MITSCLIGLEIIESIITYCTWQTKWVYQQLIISIFYGPQEVQSENCGKFIFYNVVTWKKKFWPFRRDGVCPDYCSGSVSETSDCLTNFAVVFLTGDSSKTQSASCQCVNIFLFQSSGMRPTDMLQSASPADHNLVGWRFIQVSALQTLFSADVFLM